MIREQMRLGGVWTHRARRGEWEVLARWIRENYGYPEAAPTAAKITYILGDIPDHEPCELILSTREAMAVSYAVRKVGKWEQS